MDKEDHFKKFGKEPLDYSYFSTEEEELSDYEVDDDEMYPKRR